MNHFIRERTKQHDTAKSTAGDAIVAGSVTVQTQTEKDEAKRKRKLERKGADVDNEQLILAGLGYSETYGTPLSIDLAEIAL